MGFAGKRPRARKGKATAAALYPAAAADYSPTGAAYGATALAMVAVRVPARKARALAAALGTPVAAAYSPTGAAYGATAQAAMVAAQPMVPWKLPWNAKHAGMDAKATEMLFVRALKGLRPTVTLPFRTSEIASVMVTLDHTFKSTRTPFRNWKCLVDAMAAKGHLKCESARRSCDNVTESKHRPMYWDDTATEKLFVKALTDVSKNYRRGLRMAPIKMVSINNRMKKLTNQKFDLARTPFKKLKKLLKAMANRGHVKHSGSTITETKHCWTPVEPDAASFIKKPPVSIDGRSGQKAALADGAKGAAAAKTGGPGSAHPPDDATDVVGLQGKGSGFSALAGGGAPACSTAVPPSTAGVSAAPSSASTVARADAAASDAADAFAGAEQFPEMPPQLERDELNEAATIIHGRHRAHLATNNFYGFADAAEPSVATLRAEQEKQPTILELTDIFRHAESQFGARISMPKLPEPTSQVAISSDPPQGTSCFKAPPLYDAASASAAADEATVTAALDETEAPDETTAPDERTHIVLVLDKSSSMSLLDARHGGTPTSR